METMKFFHKVLLFIQHCMQNYMYFLCDICYAYFPINIYIYTALKNCLIWINFLTLCSVFLLLLLLFSKSATSRIITELLYHPHPSFCGSQPQSMIFFISQHGEFKTQPTQTTFTVWQMKPINNLKHALAVAHTITPLNMFLGAREMLLHGAHHTSLQ